MNIDITVRHDQHQKGLDEYINSKLEHIAERFPYMISAHVILEEEKKHFNTKIVMQAGRNLGIIEGHETHEDQRASFDLAYHKIEAQILAKKEKLVEHH
ncbi:MAG: HPF/RaiA family ribosome-associated protein [Kiritimatiellae bacterium]|jgi:ribosomal subunit interface protein|nr:HPF/RaiA family ribosome-associated protein [Kiritimatiellia bacterium]